MVILKQEIGCLLGLMTLLLSLVSSVSAYLLVLNRVNNQLDKPVKMMIKGGQGKQLFHFIINPHENKKFQWSSVWLADSGSQDTGAHGLGGITIEYSSNRTRTFPYHWAIFNDAFSHWFAISFHSQATVTAGIYPAQERAWTHIDISPGGIPSIHAGG